MSDVLVTTPQPLGGLPIRTLRVDVLEGPDAGRSHVATEDKLAIGTAIDNDLMLEDDSVSRYHVELSRGRTGVRIVDCGSTNGTLVHGIAIGSGEAPAGSVLSLGRTRLRVSDGEEITLELHDQTSLAGVRGRSPVMRRLMSAVERAARSEVSVLVVGESGTGKELVARALHDLGPRAERPFVAVDCGALSPSLVASELFGHERGAFTGAEHQHVGAFERASGGTLFLDEIGELPLALQANLLGVLERRKLRRLGGRADLAVDVRVVSATNRDVRADVNSGAFRLDLYYRLAVVTLRLPPLRERTEDIALLVEHFLREAGHDGPVDELISAPTMRSLATHHWPGNVRELRNLIEATLAMGEPPPLDQVQPGDPGDPFAPLLAQSYRAARIQILHQFEARYLAALLARCGGNVSRAAREAEMNRSHLIEMLQRHRLR
ncbi:MAG TPA: sigma 54-interacting transcriptional regulator [Kofleriaceae bacterium]|nr:sigma 54-interacting transcriptional regulator [Kofleriaceae bacterium]